MGESRIVAGLSLIIPSPSATPPGARRHGRCCETHVQFCAACRQPGTRHPASAMGQRAYRAHVLPSLFLMAASAFQAKTNAQPVKKGDRGDIQPVKRGLFYPNRSSVEPRGQGPRTASQRGRAGCIDRVHIPAPPRCPAKCQQCINPVSRPGLDYSRGHWSAYLDSLCWLVRSTSPLPGRPRQQQGTSVGRHVRLSVEL
jgi:hypothetical protein